MTILRLAPARSGSQKCSFSTRSVSVLVYALKILSLLNFCLISGERGPGFGDTPGGPAELLPWPGGVPYSARPGLMCLSTLDVPVAGGELAHRGTCPTLVLYLFKRNTPQNKSISIL